MSYDGYQAGAGPRRDDEVTRMLRTLHAPPADPAYWSGLEARIMARVLGRAPEGGWDDVLAGWARLGVVAAGLALLAALALVEHTRGAEARMAYEAVVTPRQAAPLQTVTRSSGAEGREETLYYLISH
jgi:hypothetical protein